MFKVRGMDCAEEVAILKRALKEYAAEEDDLGFDLLNGKLTVSLAHEGVTAEAIEEAIGKTGMQAIRWDRWQASQSGSKTESLWTRRGRLIMCAVSGAFLAVYAVLWTGMLFTGIETTSGYAMFAMRALLAGAVVSGGWFVFPKALYSARKMRPDMNLLMTVAVAGALVIGEWFEAATVTFLFALALLLESWSVGRARKAISELLDLSPATARYICPQDGAIEEKPVDDVPIGVTAIVRPGEKIPLDGVVTSGRTSVNQAAITGESMPVSKAPGDEVFAGTLNVEGAFEFRVSRTAGDTTLATIIHMVEQAQTRRAPSERWVDQFARYYTPAMMVTAIVMAILPPLISGQAWSGWFYQALVVLVIACPCALVISTPVSIVAGLATAARAGVLIKGGLHLEAPSRLKAIALDKTGTLTYGRPDVQEIVPLNAHTNEQLLSHAASLESRSEHPLAKAIVRKAEEQGIEFEPAATFTAIPGEGGTGHVQEHEFWIGSHRMMADRGLAPDELVARAEALQDAGHSVVAMGDDTHVCGLMSLADGIRPGAQSLIAGLKHAGIEHIVMLTGDNAGTARAVAGQVGIEEYRAELLPRDKLETVQSLVDKYGQVAMVGDGVNDAPALSVATLGIAMGAAGSDAAIETADIALMSDDLSKLPWLIRHSKKTLRVIQQNISFALGVKLIFLALAMTGLATLWMAIAADMGASLIVIANALRLLQKQPQ